MRTVHKEILAVAAYVIVGFLTFGHVYNGVAPREDCGVRPNIIEEPDKWDRWYSCKNPRANDLFGFDSFMAGAFWPVYWGGKAAIEVTK